LVLLMGSERQGLPPACLEACDEVVSIAMAGRSDSLNLSIAAGVVLYEIYYQRHPRREGKR
jgi:tRNA G18 (ribose-2'-O)-methylase SpoU